MQPIVMVESRVSGMVYLNGRFAGEADDTRRVTSPVTPYGTLYVELRPFSREYLPLTARMVFSAGQLVAESFPEGDGVYAIGWPGGVTELELAPASVAQSPVQIFETSALEFAVRVTLGKVSRIEMTGMGATTGHMLPEGAKPPQIARMGNFISLSGETEDSRQYISVLSSDAREMLGSVIADRAEIAPDGGIRAVSYFYDDVGHACIRTCRVEDGRIVPHDAEPAWAQGAPVWPDSPVKTALCALEAEIIGLSREAEGYLSPRLKGLGKLRQIAQDAADCVEMRYALPSGNPAVGLVYMQSANCARVEPVYFRAEAQGGTQGAWRIEAISRMENLQ